MFLSCGGLNCSLQVSSMAMSQRLGWSVLRDAPLLIIRARCTVAAWVVTMSVRGKKGSVVYLYTQHRKQTESSARTRNWFVSTREQLCRPVPMNTPLPALRRRLVSLLLGSFLQEIRNLMMMTTTCLNTEACPVLMYIDDAVLRSHSQRKRLGRYYNFRYLLYRQRRDRRRKTLKQVLKDCAPIREHRPIDLIPLYVQRQLFNIKLLGQMRHSWVLCHVAGALTLAEVAAEHIRAICKLKDVSRNTLTGQIIDCLMSDPRDGSLFVCHQSEVYAMKANRREKLRVDREKRKLFVEPKAKRPVVGKQPERKELSLSPTIEDVINSASKSSKSKKANAFKLEPDEVVDQGDDYTIGDVSDSSSKSNLHTLVAVAEMMELMPPPPPKLPKVSQPIHFAYIEFNGGPVLTVSESELSNLVPEVLRVFCDSDQLDRGKILSCHSDYLITVVDFVLTCHAVFGVPPLGTKYETLYQYLGKRARLNLNFVKGNNFKSCVKSWCISMHRSFQQKYGVSYLSGLKIERPDLIDFADEQIRLVRFIAITNQGDDEAGMHDSAIHLIAQIQAYFCTTEHKYAYRAKDTGVGAIKHIERLILFVSALRQSQSWKHFTTICLLGASLVTQDSGIEWLAQYYCKIFEIPIVENQGAGDTFSDTLKQVFGVWKTVKDSEIVKRLKKGIALLVAAGVCSAASIPFAKDAFEAFYKKSGFETLHCLDLYTYIIDIFIYLYEKGLKFFQTGDLMGLFYDDSEGTKYELEYTNLISWVALMKNDNLHMVNVDIFEYERRLDAHIDKTQGLINAAGGSEKNVLVGKMLKLKSVKAEILETQHHESMRVMPFALLLYGFTGVGKTSARGLLINAILRYNNIDPDPRNICTVNANDKYQSEYKTRYTTVILDDIANSNIQFMEGNHTRLIIDMINNDPKYTLQADIASKGKVAMRPMLAVGTTNVKDMCAGQLSNEPVSITRRFHYTITQSVRPEFCKTGTFMLDPSKMVNNINDAFLFKVEYVRPIQQIDGLAAQSEYVVEKDINGVPMEAISLHELIKFMCPKSQVHYAQQRRLVEATKVIHETSLCPHDSYAVLCPDCIANQGETDFECLLAIGESISTIPRALSYSFGYSVTTGKLFNLLGKMVVSRHIIKSRIQSIVLSSCIVCGALCLLLFKAIGAHPSLGGAILLWLAISLVLSWIGIKYYVDKQMTLLESIPYTYIQKSLKKKMMVKRFGTLAMVVGGLYVIRRAYVSWVANKPVIEEQGSEHSQPKPDVVQRENPWKAPYIHKIEVDPKISTATLPQMIHLVGKKLAYADFSNPTTRSGTRCDIFPLRSHFWLVPYHIIKGEYTTVKVNRMCDTWNGPNFHSKICPNLWRRIGNTDLAVIYLANGGSEKDMMHLLPKTLTKVHKPGHLVYKDKECNIVEDAFNCEPIVRKVDDCVYNAITYETNFPTFPGLCMATILSKGLQPYILGFHVAGVTGKNEGYAHQITFDEVYAAILELDANSSITYQGARMELPHVEDSERGIYVAPVVHRKSPANYLSDDATFNHYGTHNGNRRTCTSRIITSIISDVLTDESGVPIMHGPPANISTYKPWQAHLESTSHTTELDPEILEQATDDLRSTVIKFLHKHPELKKSISPLDNVSVLSGVDGVHGIDAVTLKTSAGWPYNKPKKEILFELGETVPGITRPLGAPPEIWAEVDRVESLLLKGERCCFIFRASPKDEPTKIGKEKVRIFAGQSIIALIVIRRYFLPIGKLMMDFPLDFECAVGTNAFGKDWTILTEHMLKYGKDRVVAGDYKSFDTTMSVAVMVAAMSIFILVAEWAGYSDDQITIMKGVVTELTEPIYELNGEFVGALGSNPSGQSLTVFLNNLVNSLYLRYAYYAIYRGKASVVCLNDSDHKSCGVPGEVEERILNPPGMFQEHVAVMCYGDDNKMSVSEEANLFNHTNIQTVLAGVGITYTMADKESESVPFIRNEDCNFLKRSAVWSDKYKCYLAPLEETSIFKSLHCVEMSDSLTPKEHAAACMEGAMREWFFYGEDRYNEMRSILLRVAQRVDMVSELRKGTLMTFAEAERKYVDGLT